MVTVGLGFLKSPAPQAKADVKDDPEDIEFFDEDLEEEPPETASDVLPGFDGPRNWEEVEEHESQRVSLSISSHAVPSNDSGEAAARLAWQAAALEAENQDPLGLGRIDAHGLRLVSDYCICCNCARPTMTMTTERLLTPVPPSQVQDRSSGRTAGNRRNVSPTQSKDIAGDMLFSSITCDIWYA